MKYVTLAILKELAGADEECQQLLRTIQDGQKNKKLSPAVNELFRERLTIEDGLFLKTMLYTFRRGHRYRWTGWWETYNWYLLLLKLNISRKTTWKTDNKFNYRVTEQAVIWTRKLRYYYKRQRSSIDFNFFKGFCRSWDVHHQTSSSYHYKTNGRGRNPNREKYNLFTIIRS